MMWNLYIRVFIKSPLLHCKIFWQFRNQWIHFAVNGLKMCGYRCQTVNHNWPVYFFRLDIPQKEKKKKKTQTPLYLWFNKAEDWTSSNKALPTVPYYVNYQTFPSPTLWSFDMRKRGSGCHCLQASTHSLPRSQPACSPRFLSQVRVKARSHTMDCSWIRHLFFFFFFPDGFYEICCSTLFSAAPLSSGAALMFGHHLSLFWLSLGSWWVSRGSEGGREECVRTTWAHTLDAGGNVFLSSQRGLW